MPYHISDSWLVGTSAVDHYEGDRYGVTRDDTFQLGGFDPGTVGGVNNNWDSFDGGAGIDRIYVAPKSGYSWTAVMIETSGVSKRRVHSVQYVRRDASLFCRRR